MSNSQTTVLAKHWDVYQPESSAENTHMITLGDHRAASGQVYVGAVANDTNLEEEFGVTVEINTNPLAKTSKELHAPCAHVHFDHNNMAFSVFKVGNKLLLRLETGVVLEPAAGIGESGMFVLSH